MKKSSIKILLALCFVSGFFPDGVRAQNDPNSQPPQVVRARPEAVSKDVIRATETLEQKMIRKNIEWSQRLDSYAEGVDLFLIGKKVSTRRNETSIRLENSSFWKDQEGIHNTSNINANLRLPNVEDYWQLKFTSYDESEERRNVQRRYLRQTARRRNYGASLGLLQSFGPIKAKFIPRVELQNPLKVSHSISAETVAEVETYQVNPSLELFANPDKGTGVFASLHLNFVLSNVWNFTILNDGEYQENENRFTSNTGFSFGQSLSEKRGLSYNLYFSSNNRDVYHLETYSVSVGWTEVLYTRILEYDVTPFLEFQRNRSFTGQFGTSFNIAFIF